MRPYTVFLGTGGGAETVAEVGLGSSTSLTIEKCADGQLRAQLLTYSGRNREMPVRAEWGLLSKLAPQLRRRWDLTAKKLVYALVHQRAPADFVHEVSLAMEEKVQLDLEEMT
jgi:hypothetical protein